MTIRLRKEIREVLPVFAGMLLLMVAPRLIWHGEAEALGMFTIAIFALGCLGMAAMAFGSEFQYRTLGLLLAQPVKRSVLWNEKMAVLGTAMALAFVAVLACLSVASPDKALPPGLLVVLATVLLCAFCGTPYLTLLARSGLGGAVFAAALPMFLAGCAAAAITHFRPQVQPEYPAVGCLLLYCPVMCWRGYRRFGCLELKDGPVETMALPAYLEQLLSRAFGWAVPRVTGPGLALVKKELRQQQTSFLLAGIFTALVAVSALVRWRSTDWGDGLFILEFAIYLILLPFIVGTIAVAEERTLGIAEWQLILPASAWKQWGLKVLVTLPTALVLGLVLPGVLYVLGLQLFNTVGTTSGFASTRGLWFCLLELAATTVALYTTSVCGSTIRAILAAFGLIVTSGAVVVFAGNQVHRWEQWHGYGPNRSDTLTLARWGTTAVLMVCLLQWLAFRNFRRCGAPGWRWGGQVAVILLVWTVLVAVNAAVLLFV